MTSETTELEPAAGKEPKWLTLARAEVGIKEGAGSDDNPAVVAYYKDAGHPEIRHDAVAWCAAYTSAMLERAGVPSAKTLSAREYMTWGKKLDKPAMGCVCVFSRGDPRSYQGHVGFYLGEAEGRIKVLGGNQGDAVSVAMVSKSRLLGYRWPVTSSNSRTFKSQAAVVAGTAVSVTSGLAASSPELMSVAGEVKALSHFLPWAIFIGAAIAIIASVATIHARWKDLAEKGR